MAKTIENYNPSIIPSKVPLKVGDKFAVYGTLRKGCGNYRALGLDKRASYIGTTTVKGVLVSLGGFPGLYQQHPDLEGLVQDVVVDIFEVTDPRLPPNLDGLEGYSPDLPLESNNFYIRAPIKVGEEEIDIYYYQRPVSKESLIESGDWLNRY